MDAGFSTAVCVALIGMITTVIAARQGGGAQKETAQITARAEHRSALWAVRDERYGRLIKATAEMINLFGDEFLRESRSTDSPPLYSLTDDFSESFKSIVNEMRVAWLDVSITGPRDIRIHARTLRESAITLEEKVNDARELNRYAFRNLLFSAPPVELMKQDREDITQRLDQVATNLDSFISAANDILDDDGTR